LGKDSDFKNDSNLNDNPLEGINSVEEIVIIPFDEDLDKTIISDVHIQGNNNKATSDYSYEDIRSKNRRSAASEAIGNFFKNKFKPFWLNNNKRNLKIFFIAFIALLFLILSLAGTRIFNLLKNINADDGFNFDNSDESYVEEEETDFEAMHDVSDASSINDLLYQWATNGGDKLSSKNVINVMLFGADNYDETGNNDKTRTGSRSDTMILVSLNKKTEKITLVSFLRDSYTYMNINGEKRFFKINAAFNWGGPATVVKTIEDNYKIAIDKYVCVDFDSFPKIIDSLGGVKVDVKPYEAEYTQSFFNFPMVSGKQVTLTGEQALGFSRIRKSDADGDISRARRQRSVIMAMIKSAKDASISEFNSALDFVFPNIRTNYSKPELLTLGSQALLQGWADYEIIQLTSPAEGSSTSATIDTNWVWIIDYPLEAQGVQTALYGESNIILDSDRITAINILTPKSNSSSSSATKVTATASQGKTTTKEFATADKTTAIEDDITTNVTETTYMETTVTSTSVPTTTEPATISP
jgi:polyisoprenyl-teichoic acid--peptidoglycan teichoic acid transferase